MRKLSVVELLDGVMQGLGGPVGDREGGFEYGGWSGPYGNEAAQQAGGGVGQTPAYLFGRKTCEHMAAHWPHVAADYPIRRTLLVLACEPNSPTVPVNRGYQPWPAAGRIVAVGGRFCGFWPKFAA